jgi:hypothetical protein
MLLSMPRPSRLDEAKEQLQAYYAERGAMPSIGAFAELMGYRSPSSAHDVTKALVLAGFLARDERGGRLLPGPAFPRQSATPSDQLPAELRQLLPTDVPLQVVVVNGKTFEGEGLLKGDNLILAPPDRLDLSSTFLLAKGRQRALSTMARDGWTVVGVVVAQFRSYRSD